MISMRTSPWKGLIEGGGSSLPIPHPEPLVKQPGRTPLNGSAKGILQ